MQPPSPDSNPAPYIPPAPEMPVKTVARLSAGSVGRWLVAGMGDMLAFPGIAAFYGVSFCAMAFALGSVFKSKPEYTMSLASGCLLLGPFLALGLYEVSRRREQGTKPSLFASVTCWQSHIRSMGMLVLVLIVLELLWGRASLIVFAVFFNTGMPSTTGVIEAVFNPQNWEFVVAYTLVGGFFAALVFALSVVSIPMILDRDTDAISAAITSLEVVLRNTAVMALWGATITLLVGVALALPFSVGLLLVGPLMGHASWHAYRGAVQWP